MKPGGRADRTGGGGEAGSRVLSRPAVVRLLVVMAAASGCLDVFCLTRLGGFFASVITGNLVQFGRGIGTADARLLAGGAAAVGGYALGVAGGSCRCAGSRRAGMVARKWSPRPRRCC